MDRRPPSTVEANGPPPAAAGGLYVGSVMHARLRPVGHRFDYRVANLLVDLDRLDEADRASPFFSVGRFNLFSFSEADHLPDPEGAQPASLRTKVDRLLAARGVARPDRVLLLCYPRVLGYVFDPISVYWALDGGGAVTAIIYEVRNTFGGLHVYVSPVLDGQSGPAGIRQDCAKRFHVSPFMDMNQRYEFRLLPPGEAVKVRILERDAGGPTLAATFAGSWRPLATRSLLGVFAAMPLHTLKVLAGIHFEALRLWLKGAPFFREPETTKTPSLVGKRLIEREKF